MKFNKQRYDVIIETEQLFFRILILHNLDFF